MLTFRNHTNLRIGLWLVGGAHNPVVDLAPAEQRDLEHFENGVVSQAQSAPDVAMAFDIVYLPANQVGFTLPGDGGVVNVNMEDPHLMISTAEWGTMFVHH